MKEEKLFKNQRVNLNLSVDTIKKVKEYAIENGISATAAYSVLINKGLNFESFMKDNNSYPFETLKRDIKYLVLHEPIEYNIVHDGVEYSIIQDPNDNNTQDK